MVIKEKIEVILELISKSFLNPMSKANKKMKDFNGQFKDNTNIMKQNSEKLQKNNRSMSVLNKSLSLQQIKYNNVGVEMSKIKERVLELQSGTRKLTGSQKKQIGMLNGEMSILKQKRQVISSSILKTKGQIMTSQRSTESIKSGTAANMGFFKTMRLSGEQFKEVGKRQHLLTKRTGKFAFALRKGLHGMRGFKMEMLGVMFFGMSMTRLFGGLIKTSTNWLGVWEIMSAALGILFLPLAKKLMQWAVRFLKWVTKLTPKQKKWINMIVAAGIAIGILLTVVGTLALGLGSLVLAFGFLFSPIGLVITALATLAGFSFLNNMFNDVGDAVGFAEEKLISFGVSADSIDTVKDKFRGMISTISTMTEEWKTIGISVAKGLVSGVVTYFKDNPLIVVGAIAGAFLGGPAGAAIGAAIGTLFKNLKMSNITELLDSGLEMLDELIKGVMNNLGKLGEVVTAIAEKLTSFILEHINDFIEIGVTIGLAIAKGIGRGIAKSFSISGQAKKSAELFLSSPVTGIDFGKLFNPGQDDFIYRPGEGATPINPNDTVVGFKGSPPDFGGGGANITNIFNGFTMEELKRELDDRDRQMVSQMEANR